MFTICKNPILQLHALLLKKYIGNIVKNCTKTMTYLQWIIIIKSHAINIKLNYVQKILFYIIILIKKYFFTLRTYYPPSPSIHRLMASTYTTWYQFPPTEIEPNTSSFPRINLNFLFTHQVPSLKPPNPHAPKSV